MAKSLFQYCRLVKVAVTRARAPCAVRFFAARAAFSREENTPYTADPDPESEAYCAPERSSTSFTSRNSGCFGKTTFSKSFSIPVRTRSSSGLSARPPPLAETPDPRLVSAAASHAEISRLDFNILSELGDEVNWSQSAKAFGVDTAVSGNRTTQGVEGKSDNG